MRQRCVLWLSGLACLVMFVGCSNASGTSSAGATPTSPPKLAHAGQTAAQLLAGLKAKKLPIGASFTFTAANDENNLLGRPGQYTGKVNWIDTRYSSDDQGANISTDDGGSIEVFANATDAQNRYQYVSNIAKSGGIFAEYDTLDGLAFLRLSRQLTPDQAQAFVTAFKSLP